MEQSLASVFKAYDIRGLSPEQIDIAFAKRLGKAVAAHFRPKKVLVGRDMRVTSFPLESSLIDALNASGVDVVRIGLCSTPMFNILLGLADNAYDLGIMITASHNPGKYNGFKIATGDCQPVGEGSGMEEIRDAFFAGADVSSDHVGTAVDDPAARDRYIDYIISLADLPADMPNLKVAIDAGNGMAGAVLPRLLAKLPWLDVIPLYFDLDGTFPNHEANPLKSETLTDLKRVVVQEGCIAGVAFDGDADRVGFVDEHGKQLSGDLLTAFFAQEILQKHPGALMYYNVNCSWTVPEVIAENGGHSEICKVGHANIKRRMRRSGAVFAGETSMHFYFKELWYCESGDLAMLLLFRRYVHEGKPLSELWKPLRRYVHSEEINFKVADKQGVINRLKSTYAPKASKVLELDGIRLEFRDPAHPENDWWFGIRASNTEPLLRLNAEAMTKVSLDVHLAELEKRIMA